MRLPTRRNRTIRGQGLVEFALVLPILLLLMLMALDFGRVYFGWVALQNASRIAADYAAGHAEAWDGNPTDPISQGKRAQYRALVLADLKAINCDLPSPAPVPDPQFSGSQDGALVKVTLDCSFDLLTPLAENVTGGPIPMKASSEFAVYRTITAGLPPVTSTPPPTPPACSAPVASFTVSTTPASGKSPVSASFTNTSTAPAACTITSYLWDFGNGNTSTAKNPPAQTYTNPGPANNKTFTIQLTVVSSTGSNSTTRTITVKK